MVCFYYTLWILYVLLYLFSFYGFVVLYKGRRQDSATGYKYRATSGG